MKIIFFGLSITSSWGNGHATTYRALIKGLRARGHQIAFFEQDAYWYADNRDLPTPDFCRLLLVKDWQQPAIARELRECDLAVVGSYIPDGPRLIERVLDSPAPLKAFYDIDTPITMAQLRATGETSYLRAPQIPAFDVYFSFTGGPALTELESRFGAQRARPLYCSVDPAQYFCRPSRRYACDMSYMGTYASDRQPKIDELLIQPALELRTLSFVVAGPQYPKQIKWPKNVRRIQHLNPRWHPHLYSSSRFTLNVTRREMVRAGYSPSVRLFEAAACGATIVSDNWPGLDEFFTPGAEILLPTGADDVKRYLRDLSETEVRRIGEAAQQRVLACHTHAQRAAEFEAALEQARSGSAQMSEAAISV